MFQSTRPRGARRELFFYLTQYSEFQSTRPRGARPLGIEHRSKAMSVSIHAPTRGATYRVKVFGVAMEFQSTRPRGARRSPYCLHLSSLVVSIHAPTRGATMRASQRCSMQLVSIHAPTRGATTFSLELLDRFMFQSTRPRGARRQTSARFPAQPRFNPRAHAGRDFLPCHTP